MLSKRQIDNWILDNMSYLEKIVDLNTDCTLDERDELVNDLVLYIYDRYKTFDESRKLSLATYLHNGLVRHCKAMWVSRLDSLGRPPSFYANLMPIYGYIKNYKQTHNDANPTLDEVRKRFKCVGNVWLNEILRMCDNAFKNECYLSDIIYNKTESKKDTIDEAIDRVDNEIIIKKIILSSVSIPPERRAETLDYVLYAYKHDTDNMNLYAKKILNIENRSKRNIVCHRIMENRRKIGNYFKLNQKKLDVYNAVLNTQTVQQVYNKVIGDKFNYVKEQKSSKRRTSNKQGAEENS